MRLPYDFLPSKNDVNASSIQKRITHHKNLEEKNIFCWRLTSLTKRAGPGSGSENPDPDTRIRICIRIRTKMSRIRILRLRK
jgi:hypothetical protein